METKKILGDTIRRLRKQQGYSQEAFAVKCKIHRTHMGLIENGKTNLTFDNIEKIAKALNIPMQKLFKDLS